MSVVGGSAADGVHRETACLAIVVLLGSLVFLLVDALRPCFVIDLSLGVPMIFTIYRPRTISGSRRG